MAISSPAEIWTGVNMNRFERLLGHRGIASFFDACWDKTVGCVNGLHAAQFAFPGNRTHPMGESHREHFLAREGVIDNERTAGATE